MTRGALVSALIDRANALVGNGNDNDEITPDEAAEAISDAIAETAEVNAEAAASGNGEVEESVTSDAPDDDEDEEPTRQKFEPIDPDAQATFGQKRLLQGLATYADGDPIRLLWPAGSDKRYEVDNKWTAGLAFEAIDAMLHYSRWVHPLGYSLVPDADAVTKFHNNA